MRELAVAVSVALREQQSQRSQVVGASALSLGCTASLQALRVLTFHVSSLSKQ